MSEPLVKYVPRILHDDGMIKFAEVAHYDHLDLKKYYPAADVDAILRQREEELALAVEQARFQERTYWKQQLAAMEKRAWEDRIIMAMGGNQTEWYARQLATVTVTEDELVKKWHDQVSAYDTLGNKYVELSQQLAASKARCTQLEEALRALLFNIDLMVYRDRSNLRLGEAVPQYVHAQQALTPTERQPA